MKELMESCDVQTLCDGLWRDDAAGCTVCLACGKRFEDGEVFPTRDGRFFSAERAAAHHAATAHGSRLEQLLCGEQRYLTLTDHQKRLMRLIAEGKTDAEIAAETGATAATVRRQRFAFREKAKQARLYLAVYQLAHQGRQTAKDALLPIHEGVKMLDDRFVITQEENDRYIKNAFESVQPLKLKKLPAKEKRKVAVLNLIAQQFEKGRNYNEKEVNAILAQVHPEEYVTLRRYLIEYGWLDRERDGSRYWVR